jgi:hypothetical protein
MTDVRALQIRETVEVLSESTAAMHPAEVESETTLLLLLSRE